VILYALIQKEFKEILRDPITLGIGLFLPLVLLFIFGYGISLDVEDVSLAVYDQDKTQDSARLVEAFTASGYFHLRRELNSLAQVNQALDRSQATLALVIPADFSEKLAADRNAALQILIDGSFSATALIVSNYAMAIVNRYNHELAERSLARKGLKLPETAKLVTRVWYNAPMKSVNYIVPGLFSALLMAFPPMLTALSIVREKERGTIEQIYVSPISPPVFILGKIIPYGAIAFVEMLLILTVGTLWFHIPFRGSLALLLSTSVIYVLATVAIGVFVSTVTRSQVGAIFLSFIVTLMPSMLFSGFLFPIATMPYMLQLYTYAFPARYFNDISRDLYLKGVGLEYIWWNALLLLIYAAVLFALASLRLKKKVA
jgi:ABC-2 type transport system permease protein